MTFAMNDLGFVLGNCHILTNLVLPYEIITTITHTLLTGEGAEIRGIKKKK